MHSGEGGRATHVIIIGAGLAGLRCGSQLLESGTVRPDQVTILEAREAIGGRLLQDGEFVTGREVELGAELIHGNCNSLTQLADEEGWPICPVFTWAHGDGGPCPSTSGQGHGLYYIARQRRMLRWDAEDEDFVHLNESLRELCEDVVDESDISLMDWLSLKRFSKDMIALAAAGYANTCGGPAESIGLNGLRRWEVGWEDEGEGDAVLGGGGSRLLVERAARGLAGCIKTQWPVKSVQYCPSGAEVIGENGESLRCSHVVVAVPLTTIQRGLVSFEPPLPRKMIEASQQYGMGRIVKLFMKFSKVWFDNDLHGLITTGFMPEFWFRVFAQAGEDGSCCLVTSFASEPFATKFLSQPEKESIKECLSQLDGMFGDDGDESPATSSFLGAKVVNWGEEPYIWGGYCYPLVGNEAGSNAAMAQSIDNVLFFAGEHTHTDAGATMQAAYDTGSRAAAEIAGTLISSREKERGAPPPLMQTGDEGGAS